MHTREKKREKERKRGVVASFLYLKLIIYGANPKSN